MRRVDHQSADDKLRHLPGIAAHECMAQGPVAKSGAPGRFGGEYVPAGAVDGETNQAGVHGERALRDALGDSRPSRRGDWLNQGFRAGTSGEPSRSSFCSWRCR